MSVLIVGSKGNMGRRYASILRHLGIEHRGLDIDHDLGDAEREATRASQVIIASPTDSHVGWIRFFAPYNLPILCEKPLSKDVAQVRAALDYAADCGTPLNMVYQYRELVEEKSEGESRYNYWNHGKDGLVWDCIQIIGLAKGWVSLAEDSPIWRCRINGQLLDIAAMDKAYINHIKNWLRKPGQDKAEILAVHQKTAEYAKQWNSQT
jgi:hypothetical protein